LSRSRPFTDQDDVPVVTACLWREAKDEQWKHGMIDFPAGHADPDGATGLFELLVDRSPEAFQRFAGDYYEVSVDLGAVRHVYALRPLDQVTPLSDLGQSCLSKFPTGWQWLA
jgi:hypothetical protein